MAEPASSPRDALEQTPDSGAGLRSKSVRGAAHMAGAGAIEAFFRLAATVILARILSPEELGLVAMVIVLLGFIEFIKDLGLGVVTMQQQDITHEEVSSLFWINVLLGIFFALSLGASSSLISSFYSDERLIAITLCLATSLVFGGIVVQPEALLFRQMRQGPLAVIRLISTIVSSALAIAMALGGLSYWSLVAREVARSAFYTVATLWYLKWLPAGVLHFKEVLRHLKLGTNLSFAFVITALTGKLDSILVGRFFGATDLGLYRQAQGLIVAPIEQFNTPIFNVAQPALMALQREGDRYRRYYQRMTGFVAMVTMPIGIFLAIYASEFTLVLLGEKWADAAPFVRAFALALTLRPTMHSCTMVLVTLGKTTPLIGLEVAYSVFYVLFILIGTKFGAVGAAIAFFAVTVLFVPLRIHYSFKDTPVSAGSMFAATKNSMAATILMGGVLLLVQNTVHFQRPLPDLALGIGFGLITYIGSWLILPGGRSELGRLVKDVGDALRRRQSVSEAS